VITVIRTIGKFALVGVGLVVIGICIVPAMLLHRD
jgi:hypothetical protein